MRRVALLFSFCLTALLTVATGMASADPVPSPRVSLGTLVCGDVTYQVVSPDNAPVGQMLTANGSNSTSVNIMILDKAASFPQSMLTLCTVYPPPPDQPFQDYFLITPVK
jgi:hypothetical protein